MACMIYCPGLSKLRKPCETSSYIRELAVYFGLEIRLHGAKIRSKIPGGCRNRAPARAGRIPIT